jgi:HAD superfamily hydrolase (TIGR01509 family)
MGQRRRGAVEAAGEVAAVIFDFDGLLMDTESTSLRSWQFEWRQWGLTLDVATFFAGHGGDITEQRYAELAAAVGPGFDGALSRQRRTEYRDKLHESLDIAPGLRDWLDEASGLGLRLAVASSSPVGWLVSHLSRARVLDCFDVIAGGDEVARHKPEPDVYQLALERLQVSPAHAVAVEDTPHGVTAAQAAGMRCIAIPNPFVSASKVGLAQLVIGSAAQITLTEALRRLCA